MEIKYLSISKAREEFQKIQFEDYANYFDTLPNEYKEIRNSLIDFNMEIEIKEYLKDLDFGLYLYEYFLSKPWFNLSLAANYDFWRYICIKVVPDIIYIRHKDIPSYYYEKNVRMYIPTLWWYIHMSWQGDKNSTYNVLLNNSTDTIQSLVERPGKKGVHLETYRSIIKYFSNVDKKYRTYKKEIYNYKNEVFIEKDYILFRQVMVLHTAKSLVINPDLYNGGPEAYVEMLFKTYIDKIEGDKNGSIKIN